MTNRQKFLVLENIFMELQASGVTMDIAQLDWAVRTYEDRIREAEGEEWYRYEQAQRRTALEDVR